MEQAQGRPREALGEGGFPEIERPTGVRGTRSDAIRRPVFCEFKVALGEGFD